MIVTEHRLRDLVGLIPSIRINDSNNLKPFFGWGNKDELNRTLKEYKSSIYPLIWLLPGKDDYNYKSEKVIKDCSFIIATLETKEDLLNPTRYEYNFKIVLNPLTSLLIEGLRKSSITRVISDNIGIFKQPNYSEIEKDGVIDLWDATRIDCKIEINNNCLRDIKWQDVSV